MADAEPIRPRRKRNRTTCATLPLPDCVALVLQGGGALGSYQAGVIEALEAHGVEIDWVAGISIGAVNAAIVAGNPPERRVERLREFWSLSASILPDLPLPDSDIFREWAHELSAGVVLAAGVPGFFRPRLTPPQWAVPGSEGALSYYDSAPLRETLDRLVDWDMVNNGDVRLSIGAVEIESGNFRYFDTETDRIDARHIMASGALPPGLPPVEIDGKLYWDGGLVSNTPLIHVLDHQDQTMLVFQCDLFSAKAERPRTLSDVMGRLTEIRYSSRTRQVTSERVQLRQEREEIRRVLAKLPKALCDDPDIVALRQRADELPVNIVHLIHRPRTWEGANRDFEFSQRTVRELWQSGHADVTETIANSAVLANNIEDGKTAAFDLTRK